MRHACYDGNVRAPEDSTGGDEDMSKEREYKEYDLDLSEERNMQAMRRLIQRRIDLSFQLTIRRFTHGQDELFVRIEQDLRRVENKILILYEWTQRHGWRW